MHRQRTAVSSGLRPLGCLPSCSDPHRRLRPQPQKLQTAYLWHCSLHLQPDGFADLTEPCQNCLLISVEYVAVRTPSTSNPPLQSWILPRHHSSLYASMTSHAIAQTRYDDRTAAEGGDGDIYSKPKPETLYKPNL